jgi:hypothetical protein
MFKRWDRSITSNYRPISLLTSFTQTFEKLIYARLHDHLHQLNILTLYQYGFTANSSMEKATYNLLHELLLAMDSKYKYTVGGIFCDLQKAFLTVFITIYCWRH